MAKKNRYKGMSKQEIEAVKSEKKLSLILALMFMLMMLVGIVLARADSCGNDNNSEPDAVSPTVVSQTDPEV